MTDSGRLADSEIIAVRFRCNGQVELWKVTASHIIDSANAIGRGQSHGQAGHLLLRQGWCL